MGLLVGYDPDGKCSCSMHQLSYFQLHGGKKGATSLKYIPRVFFGVTAVFSQLVYLYN